MFRVELLYLSLSLDSTPKFPSFFFYFNPICPNFCPRFWPEISAQLPSHLRWSVSGKKKSHLPSDQPPRFFSTSDWTHPPPFFFSYLRSDPPLSTKFFFSVGFFLISNWIHPSIDHQKSFNFNDSVPSSPYQQYFWLEIRNAAKSNKTMVFCQYNPGLKILAVQMALQNHSFDFIRTALGENISRQSFHQWIELFHTTCRVIWDPEEYEKLGQPERLTNDEKIFMYSLVQSKPGLFLDEIREQVYDSCGSLVLVETIQKVLRNWWGVTLKKASTINIRKDLVAKYEYLERMSSIPAEFLVFTDETVICSRDLLWTHARSAKG